MIEVEFILYVSEQERSKNFYQKLLQIEPSLDVPGMTEFNLPGCKLGLMPENGISKILQQKTKPPELGTGIPRCEIYLKVPDAISFHQRGIELGAKEISPAEIRSWGDLVSYLMDKDGHIIAFAQSNHQ